MFASLENIGTSIQKRDDRFVLLFRLDNVAQGARRADDNEEEGGQRGKGLRLFFFGCFLVSKIHSRCITQLCASSLESFVSLSSVRFHDIYILSPRKHEVH